MLRSPPTTLRLEVRLSPEDVGDRLRSSMAVVRSFLLSPAWGSKEDFIGQVDRASFKMRVRHGYSNGLTRLFYGTVRPAPFGSLVEGQFRTLRFVVLLLRGAWLAFLLMIVPYLLDMLRLAREGVQPDWFDVGMRLVGPVGTVSLLVAIEIIARRMGDRDEEKMRRGLAHLFADAHRR